MTVDERALDLLVEGRDRALDPREQAELRERLRASAGWREDDLELAEAALWASVDAPAMPERARAKALGTIGRDDPLAQTLRVRERDDAAVTLPIQSRVPERDVTPPPTVAPRAAARPERTRPIAQLRRRSTGGWIAAALAAGVAAFGWWPRIATDTPAQPTPAALRAELLARPGAQRLDWAAAGDPLVKEIAGDVVWDTATQTGSMRFVGLPPNDPTQHQYQLWIFDAERDEKYPVDGGVFDIGAAGEVVVPIVAKIRVAKPTLFAVTLEKPGGVVVSSREHLLTVAKVM